MFTDKRSKKIILAAHCILNQSAKIDACAYYPGAIREVSQLLLEAGIGIIQMPCPELLCLGLDRQADPGAVRTIETEDSRVACLMRTENSRSRCRALAEPILYQLEEYRKHGFTIAGLVGVNGSPTCGVDTAWADGREYAGRGVFIEIIEELAESRRMELAMTGIKAKDPAAAVAAVAALLGGC